MFESKYLKDDVKNIQQLFAIPALRNFESKNLGKLVRLSKVRNYADGECIIQEGDTDSWLYFLLSGKIRVEKAGVPIRTIDKMGEIFGEMRILDSLSRSASVFAVGKTVCLAVNTAATERIPSDDETARFLLMLYKVFAEYVSVRLRLTNEALIDARKRIDELEK